MPTRAGFRLLSFALVLATGSLVATLVWPVEPLPPLQLPPGSPAWLPHAAEPAFPFAPTPGQDGKDVVWIPSAEGMVDAMLDLAGVTGGDYLVDLGSGDGRTVIAAAARGARALGIEYDPGLVDVSKRAAEQAGVSDRASFVKADIFQSEFSDATVITMFLLPSINLQLRPRLLALKPGTRIVSNTFTMDDWLPDGSSLASRPCRHWCLALLWIVPADVQGRWWLHDGALDLTQRFQEVTGAFRSRGVTAPIRDGRLRGETIEFRLGNERCTGRVSGEAMAGVCEGPQGTARWSAVRETKNAPRGGARVTEAAASRSGTR